MISITEAELLADIERTLAPQHGPADALTANEFKEKYKLSHEKVLLALKAFGKQGRLTVHQVYRPSVDGRSLCVPAYVIAPAKKKRR